MARGARCSPLQLKLLALLVGALVILAVIQATRINYLSDEVTTLRNQVVTLNERVVSLNATQIATDDKLTFLAEKLNPLLIARCHVDEIFYSPKEIPDNYTGYVFPSYDYVTDDVYGIGIICR